MWHIDQHFKARNEDCLQEFSSFSLVLVGHTERKFMLNQVIAFGGKSSYDHQSYYVIFLLRCQIKIDNFDKTFPKRCRSFVRRRWVRLPGGIHRRRSPEKTEIYFTLWVVASNVKYKHKNIFNIISNYLNASGQEGLFETGHFLIVGQLAEICLVRPAAKGQHLQRPGAW